MKLPKTHVRVNEDGTYTAGHYGPGHTFRPRLERVGLVAAIVFAATANSARITLRGNTATMSFQKGLSA